jgi:hypothetical protein
VAIHLARDLTDASLPAIGRAFGGRNHATVVQGSYFPSFLEPRRRSEQAIVAVVLEAYVNGVSTRKVDRLVEQLGIEG